MSLSPRATAGQRAEQAWKILTDAATDVKHTQTRLQALTALGLLRSPRSAKLIADAMTDPGLDVRTAAALAAGLSRDRTLEPNLRSLLNDKEPQVAFTAAMTLSKMGDHTGDDILVAVVDGERSAGPTMMHGTEHRIDNDLHNPAMLARLGAMQGASMLLGPFGFGITAFEFIHQSGGDLARVSAIVQIAKDRTEPVHKKLMAALADKDPAVRAAAAEALADYHDSPRRWRSTRFCGQEVSGAADRGGGVPAHDGNSGATASGHCPWLEDRALEHFRNCHRPVLLSFRSEAEESAFARSTTGYTITENALIRRGRFRDLVNYHGFDGHLARLQFEAELFDSIEDGTSWNVVILPGLDGDLVFSSQTGLVNHRCSGR